MIDLTSESPLSLIQAARLLPHGRGDRPVTLSCVLRWILRGARSPSGEWVRLGALRIGGRWITSREALQRFAEELTPPLTGSQCTGRSPRQKAVAADRAGRELEHLGM